MSQENFEFAMRQLCRDAGMQDEESLLQTRLLLLDDQPLRIDYLEDLDAVLVRADLGPAPDDATGNFARFLLVCNLDGPDAGHPVFALHPETGHVVLSLSVAMSSVGQDASLHALLVEQVPAVIEAWHSMLEDFVDPGFPLLPDRAADNVQTVR